MELMMTPNTLSIRHYNRLHDSSLVILCLCLPSVHTRHHCTWSWGLFPPYLPTAKTGGGNSLRM